MIKKIKILKIEKDSYKIQYENTNIILDINANSGNWTHEGINNFVLKVIKENNKNELEIEYDENLKNNNQSYEMLCQIIESFVNNYNKKISNK